MELTTGTQFMIHVNAYMCMSKYTVYMYMLNQATGLIKLHYTATKMQKKKYYQQIHCTSYVYIHVNRI